MLNGYPPEYAMTSGSPLTVLINFTVPLLLGNLLQQTYSIVDAVIVCKFLGINSLAAVGAGTSVITLILGFCTGCCCGFGIPMAQKFGAHDYLTLRRYIFISLKISAVMSIMIAIITSLLCSDILGWMKTPEKIMNKALPYSSFFDGVKIHVLKRVCFMQNTENQ